jgi:hypothetical protein
MPYWIIVPFVAAVWLVVLGIREFRRGAYVWGAVSVIVAVGLVLLPVPSHSVTFNLPSQQS